MIGYIAKIYNDCHDENIDVFREKINLFDSYSIDGVEIFETPYDAIYDLNKKSKLLDCTNVSIYIAEISDNDILKISNGNDQIIIATHKIRFKKYNDLVLGGLLKYINGTERLGDE